VVVRISSDFDCAIPYGFHNLPLYVLAKIDGSKASSSAAVSTNRRFSAASPYANVITGSQKFFRLQLN
jgi:hypothetical protein